MPPKIKQEKLAKYKNRFVRKCLEKHPIKEVEQLPYDDLKELWSQGKYIEFLEVALDKLKLLQSLPEVCTTLDLSVEEEVLKHLQDIDKTLRKFKKYFPSKHKDRRDEVLRAVEKLPTDLQRLLSNGDYKQFLEEALSEFASNLKLSKCLLAICPVLGLSNEKEVHKLVQQFFSVNCDDQEIMDITRSKYAYVTNTKFIELLPDDWLGTCGKGIEEILEEKRQARIKEATFLRELRDTPYVFDVAKLTFKVEFELGRKFRETPELQEGSLLLEAAKEFLSSIEIWLKLDEHFPPQPGVYFLYYIGEKELYPGSFVIGSPHVPVYVGMSASKISTRMADHKKKIGKAKHLDVADFAVKVIFVDIRHYAPCIEGMFIEHFDPVWNRETLGISFGSRVSSLWRKYHVDEDLDVSKEMEQKLNISGGQSESESFDDLGQSDSESVAQSDSESVVQSDSELESSDDLEQSDSD